MQSRIARTERHLIEGSIYTPIEEDYERRVTHSQSDGSMPNEAYAKSVVKQVMYRRPAFMIWEGNRSWLIWLLTSILPKWAVVSRRLSDSRSTMLIS